ncbi:hypothetical protein [Pedobacter sp. Leaf132]|uniref:hypothetical protein n=1 Tax=Pedobacter sp. Leaf132 TaxID=2876557 RepID=UPI001E31AD25|nr:hypothetical protein [Pedobacter sp. Leaf132]
MLQLLYKYINHPDYPYTIVQHNIGQPYYFYSKTTLIGSIEKIDGVWKQVSGRQTLDEVVAGMGAYIEQNS